MLKDKALLKKERKTRIRKRIRKKIKGTAERPRVFVFKSNRYVYLQAINDLNGTVIASASSLEKELRESSPSTKNKEICQLVAERLAQRLKEKNISKIVFDRGTYPFHGRVKVLAETLRQHGLSF
ncbi:MAG: 50S ribosomal protein L18 [Candidatus Aminicenantes bacterium]|nr:50S ribosomal protein L18 [Candidatus Aminicenantes bacterium]